MWEYTHEAMKPYTVLQGHESEVKAAAWSVDGAYIATCGRDKSVWVWSITDDMEFEIVSIMQEHKQDVKSVAWHPQRTILASASYDNTIKLWDYEASCDDWLCKQTLEGHTSTVWKVAFNTSGNLIVSVGGNGEVLLWKNVDSVYKLVSQTKVEGVQYTCAFHPTNDSIVTTVSIDNKP